MRGQLAGRITDFQIGNIYNNDPIREAIEICLVCTILFYLFWLALKPLNEK